MRESERYDGSVALFGDAGDTDELTAVAAIEDFVAVGTGLRCVCGAPLRTWSLRPTNNGAELCCCECHRVHARIHLSVQIHR